MNQTFDNYLFRCSSLGKLMTGVKIGLTQKQEELFLQYEARYNGEGKPLTDNQKGVFFELGAKMNATPKLSQTTKSYLEQLYLEETYGRRKDISNKFMSKGTAVEEESITLYSEITGELFVKNEKHFSNEFIKGTPDNKQGKIRDIKSSWDLFTFPMFETEIKNADYKWQLLGYMDLTGLKEAELIYCLVDTPWMLIDDEKRRFSWKNGYIDLPEEEEVRIEKEMTFSDIPAKERCKVFHLEYNQKEIDALYLQIQSAREYLNELDKIVKG